MQRLLCLVVLALAGCPPPPRYAVVDVYDPRPVQDAMVAAECGKYTGAAMRTDDAGRARLPITGVFPADRCVLTVAKPGYPTLEIGAVQLCSSPSACPSTIVELFGLRDPYERSYAEPVLR